MRPKLLSRACSESCTRHAARLARCRTDKPLKRTDFCCTSGYSVEAMATNDTPKTLGEVIDDLERLREELLTIQRALEKMELDTTAVSDGREDEFRVHSQLQIALEAVSIRL
jgi:hypothetical protein